MKYDDQRLKVANAIGCDPNNKEVFYLIFLGSGALSGFPAIGPALPLLHPSTSVPLHLLSPQQHPAHHHECILLEVCRDKTAVSISQ